MQPVVHLRAHVWLPLFVLLLILGLDSYLKLDLRLADYLFQFEGHHWADRDQWLFKSILHNGGRLLSTTLAVMLLCCLAVSAWVQRYKTYFRTLLVTVFSMVTALLLVNILKSVTDGSCPWDLQRYGGTLALSAADIFNSVKGGGHCFPAGHASGGYVWLALYFAARVHASRWRFIGLFLGLSLGLLFGVAQQFRGAHFLSHDLWTLAICWLIPAAAFNRFYSRRAADYGTLQPVSEMS